jgi:hypothetical protein
LSSTIATHRSSPGFAGFGNPGSSHGAHHLTNHSPSAEVGGFEQRSAARDSAGADRSSAPAEQESGLRLEQVRGLVHHQEVARVAHEARFVAQVRHSAELDLPPAREAPHVVGAVVAVAAPIR